MSARARLELGAGDVVRVYVGGLHNPAPRTGCGVRELFVLAVGRRRATCLYVPALVTITLAIDELAGGLPVVVDRRRLQRRIREALAAARRRNKAVAAGNRARLAADPKAPQDPPHRFAERAAERALALLTGKDATL